MIIVPFMYVYYLLCLIWTYLRSGNCKRAVSLSELYLTCKCEITMTILTYLN